MLKEFYLVFHDNDLDSFQLKHIQFNLQKRLLKLKYVSLSRINITLFNNTNGQFTIESNNNKSVNLYCEVSIDKSSKLDSLDVIEYLYERIFSCLIELWKKNNWEVSDLRVIYSEIVNEEYKVSIVYGKPLLSPNKNFKADLLCELFPQYCDYYVRISSKSNKTNFKLKYIQGNSDPSLFFSYFSNRYWKDDENLIVSDFNKEIYFIVNIRNSNCEIEFSPKFNTLEQCKGILQAFQPNISNTMRLKLLGLPT